MALKPTRNLGMLLLGVWLILTGLLHFLDIASPGLINLLGVLAIAAGALILIGR
jgi:hypothetical protein